MYLTQTYQMKEVSIRRVHLYVLVTGALYISSELK
jgi:hypothetical protein